MKRTKIIITSVMLILMIAVLTGCSASVSIIRYSDSTFNYEDININIETSLKQILEDGAANAPGGEKWTLESYLKAASEKATSELQAALIVKNEQELDEQKKLSQQVIEKCGYALQTPEKNTSNGKETYIYYIIGKVPREAIREYEIVSENLFMRKYLFNVSNIFKDTLSQYETGADGNKAVAAINGHSGLMSITEAFPLLSSETLSDLALVQYIETDRKVKSDADGSVQFAGLATSEKQSAYFRYWSGKFEPATAQKEITYTLSRAVSVGWNIVSLAVGALIVAAILIYAFIKKKKAAPASGISVVRIDEEPDMGGPDTDKQDK